MDEIPLDDLVLEIERVFERAKAEIAKEDISHFVSVCVVLAFDDGQKFQVVPAGVGSEALTVVALSRTLSHLLKNRQYLELLALLVRRKEVKELRRRLPEMLDSLAGAMYGAAQAVTDAKSQRRA
jgi:ribosomal protein S12 methylthiotransferase accessory factor YcaO